MSTPDTFDPWAYQARLERIVDGDTYDLAIDLGFRTYAEKRVRLLEIDTAETFGVSRDSTEYQTGVTHRRFVDAWFADAIREHDGEWPLIIETQQDSTGAYGRWLASVTRKSDYTDVASALLEEFGDAVRYE